MLLRRACYYQPRDHPSEISKTWKIKTFPEFQKIEAQIDLQLQLFKDRKPQSFKFELYSRASIKGVNIKDCIHNT